MAAATSELRPIPLQSSAFTAIKETPQAVPATPKELFVSAPATPATNVPWPLSSSGSLGAGLEQPVDGDEMKAAPWRSSVIVLPSLSTPSMGSPVLTHRLPSRSG